MKRLSPICTVVVVLLSGFQSLSTDHYVTIKFDRLELLEEGWAGQSFYFNVNGTLLAPDNESHRIKTSSKALDCLIFSMDSTFRNGDTTYARFKPGQSYTIRINPCSQFELIADQDARTGQAQWKTIHSTDTTFVLWEGKLVDTLVGNVTGDYFAHEPSVLCYYAPATFGFSEHWGEQSGQVTMDHGVVEASFCFLHVEKLSVTYDKRRKAITMTVEGYMQ